MKKVVEVFFGDSIINIIIEMLNKIFNLGKGYLTYAVALALLVTGLYKQDWVLTAEALGLFGLRRAIQ